MIILSRESRGGRVVSASSTALSLPHDMVSDCSFFLKRDLTRKGLSLSPIAALAECRYCGSDQIEGELSLRVKLCESDDRMRTLEYVLSVSEQKVKCESG